MGKTGDLGFEPRLTDPESVVLPLHQSPKSALAGISPYLSHPTEILRGFQDRVGVVARWGQRTRGWKPLAIAGSPVGASRYQVSTRGGQRTRGGQF